MATLEKPKSRAKQPKAVSKSENVDIPKSHALSIQSSSLLDSVNTEERYVLLTASDNSSNILTSTESNCSQPTMLQSAEGIEAAINLASLSLDRKSELIKELSLKDELDAAQMKELITQNQAKECTNAVEEDILEPLVVSTPLCERMKPFAESQLASLYFNPELQTLEKFNEEFLNSELKGVRAKQHILYELISDYMSMKNKLVGNNCEINRMKKECVSSRNLIWSFETMKLISKGQCNDNVNLRVVHHYEMSVLNEKALEMQKNHLQELLVLHQEKHLLYSYSVKVLKLQIDNYIEKLARDCMEHMLASRDDSPKLLREDEIPLQQLQEIRICVSILFSFVRNNVKDSDFLKETRNWLMQLISVLLRFAAWQDHIFILNHVLRCPSGFRKWAACLIQVPTLRLTDEPFSCPYLHHTVTVLHLVLSPVVGRQEFLKHLSVRKEGTDVVSENMWVLVDSDGEEEEGYGWEIQENDLVCLLGQIPIRHLFSAIANTENLTDNHLLRVFALSTVLIRILYGGLKTYSADRYHQFSKRLSSLIRHCLEYATDLWQMFNQKRVPCDEAMYLRLQTEYDALFLRTSQYLYVSKDMGAWQFLTAVPYRLISLGSLWQLFCWLHIEDKSGTPLLQNDFVAQANTFELDRSLMEQLDEKLSKFSDVECFYMLNIFGNMALARPAEEHVFIRTVTLELLRIGFLCKRTEESCAKCVRTLLATLCEQFPAVISDMVGALATASTKRGSYYLFSELPLHLWRPTQIDLDTVHQWIIHSPVDATDNALGRYILLKLNWGTNDDGLFLPYEFHKKVALIAMEALLQEHTPESYTILENFSWELVMRLRLHACDQRITDIATRLWSIPDADRLPLIYRGLKEKNPIASFLALMMTSYGHMVPVVATKGFEEMQNLISCGKHVQVLTCLYYILPLFAECPEILAESEKFQFVMNCLLAEDKYYFKLNRGTTFPDEKLKLFGSMLETFLTNRNKLIRSNFPSLIETIVQSILQTSNWTSNALVLYILEIIIRATFFFNEGRQACKNALKHSLKISSECASPNGGFTSLLKWRSQPSNAVNTSAKHPWLSFIVLCLEHEKENETTLWPHLLQHLSESAGKTSIDSALKKVISSHRLTNTSAAKLCIYRWANLAVETDLDHPLLPLIWQKFFMLYLEAIPGFSKRGSIGGMFFDDKVNFYVLKTLKRRLKDTVEYFHSSSETNIDLKPYHRLFTAYSLWLEEPRLHDGSLHLTSLPVQYLPDLLGLIVQRNEDIWFQYMNFNTLRKEEHQSFVTWNTARDRNNVKHSAPKVHVEENPADKIQKRLMSYDDPQPVPRLPQTEPTIPPVLTGNASSLINNLECLKKTLVAQNKTFLSILMKHKQLDSTFLKLMPQLYYNKEQVVIKKVSCPGSPQANQCSGAAQFVLKFQEATINDGIQHQIDLNRKFYDDLLSTAIMEPSTELCLATCAIEQAAHLVTDKTLAVKMFYWIFGLVNESSLSYPPVKQMLTSCLETLGKRFISGDEEEICNVCETILKNPHYIDFILPYFTPLNVPTKIFLKLFSMVTNCKNVDATTKLLSKFSVPHWLQTHRPKLSERSEFIHLIFNSVNKTPNTRDQEPNQVDNILRNHLSTIFLYEFPEHYGEVLMIVLKNTTAQTVPVYVWLDILQCLKAPCELNLSPSRLNDQWRFYATRQELLEQHEIAETASLLGKYFTQERIQCGQYGLYPKFGPYVEVLQLFFGSLSHGLVIKTVSLCPGLLADRLFESIWPSIADMFGPWVMPYLNEVAHSPPWNQEPTDDRPVLLPWVSTDASVANVIFTVYSGTVNFIIETLPACNSVLSTMWQIYALQFAHPSVKSHVLSVVHSSFGTFPWYKFWPSLMDLELMARTADQYLPECHVFLCQIFSEIPWINWLTKILGDNPTIETLTRTQYMFLSTLIKLEAVKPDDPKLKDLISYSCDMKIWHILPPQMIVPITDWFVSSTDPSNVLREDCPVMKLLRVVCCIQTDVRDAVKAHIYVKSFMKLLSFYANRSKSDLPTGKVSQALKSLLAKVDPLLSSASEEEVKLILCEFLASIGHPLIGECAQEALSGSLSAQNNVEVIKAVLRSASGLVTNPSLLSHLLERALECYYCLTESVQQSEALEGLVVVHPFSTKSPFVQGALEHEAYLLLHLMICKRETGADDVDELQSLVQSVLGFIQQISFRKQRDDIEAKIVVIWTDFLRLALKLYLNGKTDVVIDALLTFTQHLSNLAQECGKGSKGILGAIGIFKQPTASVRFGLICRLLGAFIVFRTSVAFGRIKMTEDDEVSNRDFQKFLDKIPLQSQQEPWILPFIKQVDDSNNTMIEVQLFLYEMTSKSYSFPFIYRNMFIRST